MNRLMNRIMNRIVSVGRVVRWLAVVAVVVCAAPVGAQSASGLSPWENSVLLESQGRRTEARDVMRAAFGKRPALYDPCVRLAWLSLQLADYPEAIALYRRARELAGALPEASTGLAYALVGEGYAAVSRGALADARRAFAEAHTVDRTVTSARDGIVLVGASLQMAPEVWTGTINAERNASSAKIFYAHMPVQITPDWGVRVAYRSVNSPGSTVSTTSFFGTQTEKYAALVYDEGPTTWQVVGFQMSNVLGSTTGGALGVRYGGGTGVTLALSAMSRPGATNQQAIPMLFHWFSPKVYAAVGTRLTSDSGQTRVSGLIDLALIQGPVQLDVRAHAGNERSAIDLAGPTILSFGAGTSGGGALTAQYKISTMWHVFAQGQYERLAVPATDGAWYRSLSVGVRLTMTDDSR